MVYCPVDMIAFENQQLNISNKKVCRNPVCKRPYVCGKTIGWHANKLSSNAINYFLFQIFIQSWHKTARKSGPARI